MTRMSQKASYGGCVIRNRLAIRWAMFFDAATLEWIYQPTTLLLPGGTLATPDFFLPDLTLFLNVRQMADVMTASDLTHFNELAQVTGVRCATASGLPHRQKLMVASADLNGKVTRERGHWYFCRTCNRIELGTGIAKQNCCKRVKVDATTHPRLVAAMMLAFGAEFDDAGVPFAPMGVIEQPWKEKNNGRMDYA